MSLEVVTAIYRSTRGHTEKSTVLDMLTEGQTYKVYTANFGNPD